MLKIVGVRFKDVGKIYYFSPGDLEITENQGVIVENAQGIEFGKTVI
ncbi:stage 0 sporulation protein, partial [Escherichia coli]|nr:stage 0 sporulation protein [Escherichia coli]